MASASLLTTFLILSVALTLLGSSNASNILSGGETLSGGQSISEGSYRFTMQTDCNLVLYDGNRAIWATGTQGKATGCYLAMQEDANLVIYGGGRAIWASNTNRARGTYFLIIQRDRNVVIYGAGKALWATGTNIAGTANVQIERNSTELIMSVTESKK